ncbi:MAG TPA: hypothetical protein VFP52_16910 [Myxococcales bacterium]|nr:hypothetical protein [Myxococcales bacterium]
MIRSRWLALGVFLLTGAACDNSGDFESNCTLRCALPDGGVLQAPTRIACCGVHDHPSHPGEEGSACTVDWVSTRTQQLCSARKIFYTNADGSLNFLICPPQAFQCSCDAPHRYPSYDGCD